MSLFGDNISGDNVEGDKVLGNKITYEINHIDLDIGILKDILENHPDLITDALHKITLSSTQFQPDESTIPIVNKNLLNGLNDFYDHFIKREEQKLASIDSFFKENDYIDDIENASDSIKLFIFSYANRNSLKLEPYLFNLIIQEHTKSIMNYEHKNLMKLIIYYLYRYCYIGLKDA